ncbi:hypothetical protein F5050DRAFT_1903897 [Lentinula boryana]|uniref:Uncharacterized protein n=1 Tax=Lentinula boryana TaxID=40481 RepID=A0ABQ8Q8A4_9AGAR|nr:hypothetical protein F5050DRAFT_1903897 [Lentinula boryana]
MYDNEEGHHDRNNRRASILDTPTCEDIRKNVLVSHDFKASHLHLPIPQQFLGLVISQDEFPITGRIQVFGKRHDWQKKTAPTGVDNTIAASLRKSRHPCKDEYKHTRLPHKEGSASSQGRIQNNRLPRKEGSGIATQKTRAPRKGRQTGIEHTQTASSQGRDWVSQCGKKHGLLTRSGKRALSAVGIMAARDTQLIGRTGAHNLLKYWGLERSGDD